MKKFIAFLLLIAMLMPFETAFAENSFETNAALCCKEDVYSVDYEFRVGGNANILSVDVSDKNCIFDWNFVKSEAKLYISLASAMPIGKCKTLINIISGGEISLSPVSLKTNGKDASLTNLYHGAETDMPQADPTCDLPGHKGGKICSVCGAVLKEPDITIPPTGPTVSAALSEDNALKIKGALSDKEKADGAVLVGVYGGGKLIGIYDISAQNQNNINLNIENMGAADTVKFFRWDSLSNLKPTFRVHEVKLNKKTLPNQGQP